MHQHPAEYHSKARAVCYWVCGDPSGALAAAQPCVRDTVSISQRARTLAKQAKNRAARSAERFGRPRAAAADGAFEHVFGPKVNVGPWEGDWAKAAMFVMAFGTGS